MPIRRIQPKEDFLHPAVPLPMGVQQPSSAFADMAASPVFREAVEKAMCEMLIRNRASDPQGAAAVAYKLDGARQVLEILLNLGEEEAPILRPDPTMRLEPPK